MLILQNDPELMDWVFNLERLHCGSFLRSIGLAAQMADSSNYAAMRPLLLSLKEKYLDYQAPPVCSEVNLKSAAEGAASIQEAVDAWHKHKISPVVRLFAISMVYYRQPVGDQAQDELRKIIGAEAISALYFIAGFSTTGKGENWAMFAFPDPQITNHDLRSTEQK